MVEVELEPEGGGVSVMLEETVGAGNHNGLVMFLKRQGRMVGAWYRDIWD